ncbi:DUF1223 domain-containing protein [Acidisoma cellulosilytica]|uniref:DUF1223 domain-containing protein n=1 Tax=Acidisoma cellulosilyticum TaxID=2802395 RepID=A0A963Z5X2_9PROT|nr:DUF1223 domain-containing protein [Acidisoma cellulosilyticum]MCB8883480.1 DUF1223 domain-containing protein [Acidisoma cellulosilyticum]
MRAITALMLGAAGLALSALPAKAADNPLVLELFTSQGCSSCPPADAYMAELKRSRPDLLLLDFHVDYWDRLGWHDPFSLGRATERQEFYASALHTEVYTPQLVIGGSEQAIGSARADVQTAIGAAQADRQAAAPVAVSLSARGTQVQVTVGPGQGSAAIWLVGFDDSHRTAIGRGENDGLTETEVDIVRSIQNLGAWTGQPAQVTIQRPRGERIAVLVQRADGLILSAATLPASGS